MKYCVYLAMLMIMMTARGAQPAEVTMYLMEVPPLTMNEPERKGVVGDLALEAIKRAGYVAKLIVVPSNRAMVEVQAGKDVLIIPLARLPDREAAYSWITPLAKVNRAFFTLGRRIESFEQARTDLATVAVSRGTAGVSILKAQGLSATQIYEVTQGETAPRMLLSKRVDAWYNPVAESKLLLQQIKAGTEIQMGPSLGATYNYLACARRCDPAMMAKLAEAVQAMDKDGTSKAIRARYGEIE